MAKLFANSGDPDQMPHSAASDLGLYCLPVTLLGISRLKRVDHYNLYCYTFITRTYPGNVLLYFLFFLETVIISGISL